MNFSESIKKKAIELGFQKVGIAKAEGFSNHKENLEEWGDKLLYYAKS